MINAHIEVDEIKLLRTTHVVGIASKGVILYEANCLFTAKTCIDHLPFSDSRVCIYTAEEWKRL